MPRIFISYRRDDSAFQSTVLYEALRKTFGKRSVFMDVDGIPLGADFDAHIVATIRSSDVCLAVMSTEWLDARSAEGTRRLDDPTDFVRRELELAREGGLHIIPVLLGKAALPASSELPSSLQFIPSLQAIQVRAGTDLQKDLSALCRRIREVEELQHIRAGSSATIVGRFGIMVRKCWWHVLLDALAFAIFVIIDYLVQGAFTREMRGISDLNLVGRLILSVFLFPAYTLFLGCFFGVFALIFMVFDSLQWGLAKLFGFGPKLPHALLAVYAVACVALLVCGGLDRSGAMDLASMWAATLIPTCVFDATSSRLIHAPARILLRQKLVTGMTLAAWAGAWTAAPWWRGQSIASGIPESTFHTVVQIALVAVLGSVYATAAQIARCALRQPKQTGVDGVG